MDETNTYKELREKLTNIEKYKDCKKIARCPLIHDGFPGTFNLSFVEYDLLKEFGKYQYFDHDFSFSTIQKVIRTNDIFNDMKIKPNKYLGVFEMTDVTGAIILKEKTDLKSLQQFQIKSMIELLTSQGIKKEDIFPKYCTGGKLSEITDGKYIFDFQVPEDKITLDTLLAEGIPLTNIKKDKSRDTFLSLNLYSGPMGWGYRIEFDITFGKETLDVGTIEYLRYDPIFNGGNNCENIVGLKDITYTGAASVVGVERLYVLNQGLKDIREIPHIKNVYKVAGEKSEQVEYLRTIHAIFSDVQKYNLNIGKHRKQPINEMIDQLTYSPEKIRDILTANAESQYWYPELYDGMDLTIDKITQRIKKRNQLLR